MPKYVLSPEYLIELKRFLNKLTEPLQIEVINIHHQLCSDYLNNKLSGEGDSYILPKSTTFIIKSKYGIRAHLFTRIFDDSPHKSTAFSLGILSFEAGLWVAMKDVQIGQHYSFHGDEGGKMQQGEILFRTKTTKQKHWMSGEDLKNVTHQLQQTKELKKKPKAESNKYKILKFTPKDSLEPVFYKKKQIK